MREKNIWLFYLYVFFFFFRECSLLLEKGGEEERELKGRNVRNGEEGQLLT